VSIRIHFKLGGGMDIKPSGYAGNKCHEATRPYTEGVEGDILNVEPVHENATEDAPIVHDQQQQKLGE
jgi:hypothetical protein